MKTKIQSLILLILCLVISSCSSDDDSSSSSDLEGQWFVTSLLVESAFDFNGDGNASRDLFQETSCYDGNFIQFFDDGDVTIVVDFTNIFVDSNNEQDFECQSGLALSSIWTQNGDSVTVENGNEDITGVISGNTLTVTVPDGFEMELYDPAVGHYPAEEDFTIVFTKE
ncbi:hypothetical protein [Winogradskyella flava]|uniref:hypothetical protein n=1 Tax=Winogradskyella flava TaxID=1884876 RepID=UPI0024915701|nr:hypothetical protein [Winogradskyella flava]